MSCAQNPNKIKNLPTSFRKRVLLTTAQAAEYIGYSESALCIKRCRCEGPPYFKIGRNIRYDINDLEAWIENSRIDPENL